MGRVYSWTQVTAQELMLHWNVITTSLFLRDMRLKFLFLKNLHPFPGLLGVVRCSWVLKSGGKKIWTAALSAVTSAVTHIPQPSHWQHPSGRSSYSPNISELSALAKYVKPLLTDLMQMLSQYWHSYLFIHSSNPRNTGGSHSAPTPWDSLCLSI